MRFYAGPPRPRNEVAIIKASSVGLFGLGQIPWDLETINGQGVPGGKDWGHKFIVELVPGDYELAFSYSYSSQQTSPSGTLRTMSIVSTGLTRVRLSVVGGHTYWVDDGAERPWIHEAAQ